MILIAAPALGAGQKYTHTPPKLNDEIENIYHDINSVLKGNVRISSVTVSSMTIRAVYWQDGTVSTSGGVNVTSSTNTWTGTNVFAGSTSIKGTTTNNNAAAGYIGQYVESVVGLVAAAASGGYKDITSISLSAGDWDVTGMCMIGANGATVTGPNVCVVSTSNSGSFSFEHGSNDVYFIGPSTTNNSGGTIADYRISLSGASSVYLIGGSNFTVATPNWYGRLSARRIR